MNKMSIKKIAIILALGLTAQAASAQTVSASQMLINLSSQYPAIVSFIVQIMNVIGLCIFVASIFKLKESMGERTNVTAKVPVVMAVIGVLLMNLSSGMQILSSTVGFGSLPSISKAAGDIDNMSALQNAQAIVASILGLVQIVGLISISRGFLAISAINSGTSRDSWFKPIALLAFGTMAFNPQVTIKILATTMTPNLIAQLTMFGLIK